MVKLCLTNDDCIILQMILKKWGNLGNNWESFNIESVISFSTRPENISELIELIIDNKEVRDIIQAIYIQDIFPFTYSMYKFGNIKDNYLDPGQNVNDFKAGVRVVIEF